MRGCPSSDIRITEVRPTMMPILTGRREPAEFRVRVECDGDGRGDVELLVRHHAGHDRSHRDVQRGRDHERGHDAPGHVALRVARFLRGRRGLVEADVGEEDDRRALHHAAEPNWPYCRCWSAGTAVHRSVETYLSPTMMNSTMISDLDRDHHVVRARRLLDADVAEPGQRHDDQHGGHVDDRAGEPEVMQRAVDLRERRVGQRRRQLDAEFRRAG